MPAFRRALRRAAAATLAALTLWAAAPPPAAAFQFSVSPPRVYIDYGAGRGQGRIEIANRSAAPLRLSVSLTDFRLDADNRVEAVAPTADSFSNAVVVNPVELEVPARGSRTIRFAVRPLAPPEPGERKAMIWLTRAAVPTGEGIPINVAYGVPLYATYGEVRREGELHGVDWRDGALVYDVSSGGDGHVRLQARYAAFPAGAYPGDAAAAEAIAAPDWREALRALGARDADLAPTTAVFPGERRSLRRAAPAAGSSGVIYLRGRLGDAPLAGSWRY